MSKYNPKISSKILKFAKFANLQPTKELVQFEKYLSTPPLTKIMYIIASKK